MRTNKSILLFIISQVIFGCIKRENDIIVPVCQSACATINGQFTTGYGTAPLRIVSLTINWVNTQYLSGGTIRKKPSQQLMPMDIMNLSFKSGTMN